mgnify:CR=1 FL=1
MEASWSSNRKRTAIIEFTALLARLLSRRGNRVGAIVFDGTGTRQLPAGASRDHVLYLVHHLTRRTPVTNAPPTDLAGVLRTAARTIPRRSLLFVVSDFVSRPGWADRLGELVRRHEVIGVRVVDPTERSIPDMGIVAIRDAETGDQVVVDTHSSGFRRAYEEAAAETDERIRAGFADAGVDAMELVTTDDLVASVLRFAELRKVRAQAGLAG